MLSQRAAFISAGEYTGTMTTELGISGCNYQGIATITVNITDDNNDNRYNANVCVDFLKSNCWTAATESLIFPLKHVEFTAQFTSGDIKDTVNAEQKHITTSIVEGTADLPFADKLPEYIKGVLNNGKISSSTTVEKDDDGTLSAKVTLFTGVTMFGSVKKKNTPEQANTTSPRLRITNSDVD